MECNLEIILSNNEKISKKGKSTTTGQGQRTMSFMRGSRIFDEEGGGGAYFCIKKNQIGSAR